MQSKYNIGDTVFVLGDHSIQEKMVRGIFAQYHDNVYDLKDVKKVKFRRWNYFFDVRDQVEDYQWIPEEKVFATKQDLIDSLTQ